MNNSHEGKIAIVGMACRLPGASDTRQYWSNLVNELETLTTFTDEELLASGVAPERIKSENYVRRRGIINGADMFDAEFFGFTPREAELLDPQHRAFLECSWHALEDAGIDPAASSHLKIGVFGGTGSPMHLIDTIDHPLVNKYSSDVSVMTSNDKDYLTTRVSYKLNLNGPSINLQTACSTSIVAVLLGMDSLLSYQSDVILAGAATVVLPERRGYTFQEGGLESSDGTCRTFDKDATGTVFSRGSGVVALKRMEDAVADGDHIYAVILGGAINNDGNKKAGYTAPSVEGQVEVINEALEITDVSPETISYVEAHGTATPIGDPIEVNSLSKAFSQHTSKKQYCAIGSCKTNIGHTDTASGVASLIKVALSLENKILPASLHFKSPNPKIDFQGSPFYVITKTRDWEPSNGTPLRALINSFGVGGTNACIIVEEPPRTVAARPVSQKDLLLVSARNDKAFEAYTSELTNFLKSNPETNLADLAHMSRAGRRSFEYRGNVAFSNYDELIAGLAKVKGVACKDEPRDMVFMFPGQGNQYVNMGRPLYEKSPVFREAVDKCAAILQSELKMDIRKVIYPSSAEHAKALELINETYITQPALFIVSYAMAKVWMSLGIKPDYLIGHSVGEYVAACISGIFSLEDAMLAVARRGRLIHDLPGGSMLAVLMTEANLNQILPDGLEIAVVNSPELCVVSGPTDTIKAFSAHLKEKRIFSKVIPTSHAFHSHMMDACLPEFTAFFRKINLHTPKIPIISSVTGKPLTDADATDPHYWINHVRKAVRFGDAAAYAIGLEPSVFLESGPGQSLESAVKRQLPKETSHDVISSIPPAENTQDGMDYLLNGFGYMWKAGKPIEWGAWFPKQSKISYPGYPFQRKSFQINFAAKAKPSEVKVKKKPNVKDWFNVPSWKRTPAVELLENELIGNPGDPRNWVVFTDHPFGDSLIESLKHQNGNVYVVRKGNSFSMHGNEFTVRPTEKSDYFQFAEELNSDYPLHIIHGWNIKGNEKTELKYSDGPRYMEIFDGLIYLEQALIEKNLVKDVSLIVVVDGLYDINGEGILHPENALAVGPVRVLFREHLLQMTTRLIDIRLDEAAQLNKLTNNIIREATFTTEEHIAVYRNGVRWTETHEQVFFKDDTTYTRKFREGGVYLVTGGSGGLGQLFSNLIADSVKATFIIINRSAMPHRDKWDAIIRNPGNGSNGKIIERIQFIRNMEAKGATIFLGQADAQDFDSMARIVREAEEIHGPVNGIIHTAGIAGGGVIRLQEKSSTDQVILPKVYGTLVLHDLFKEKPLDFFYVLSSISAILADPGRVDYTSANSFMDAFAQFEFQNRKAPGIVTSINFGAWGLIGMAADYQRQKSDKNKQYKYSITEGESRGISLVPMGDGTESMYLVDIDPEKDWIMCAHLLTELPTMVGTGYISLIHDWAKSLHIPGQVTVNDLKFTSPYIHNPQQEKELILVVEEKSPKSYKFKFRSRVKTTGSKASFWQDHAIGEFTIEEQEVPDLMDYNKMVRRFAEASDEGHYLTLFDKLLQFGQRWDCRTNIRVGNSEWLVELDLDEQFSDDLQQYYVHPSLLDVATSTHFSVLTGLGARLPYSYKKCTIYRPFEKKLYALVRASYPFGADDEFVAFDIDIFNPKGERVVSVSEYSFIKLDQPKPVAEKKATAVVALENDILPEEGLQAIKMLMGNETLPQVIVHTIDMHDELAETMIFYKRREAEKKVSEISDEGYERPELDTPFEEPENEIEKSIAAIWKGILGIGKIGVNDSFNALGGNSLLAIQTISNIVDEFDIELQASDFFENATIRGLSQVIVNKIIMMNADVDLENVLSEIS